jgi:alpha-methylacyl-CoA racemase
MLLADMGADIIRIDRTEGGAPAAGKYDFTQRGRRAISMDLKRPEGKQAVLRLISKADALMEGMRPGAMERLGLGPQTCLAANPRLVYGRMTGWGQEGPLALRAGHDINYIALTGALHAIGRRGEAPVPPLNLVGDYGGGGAFLAIGLLAALLESKVSGQGQVVDAAMIDGVASLMALPFGRYASGDWVDKRGENVLDGGAPWYGVYETSDGRHVAVGAIEPQFYSELVTTLGLSCEELPDRKDRRNWPELRRRFEQAFRARTRDEWARLFESTDACVTPVLSFAEAPRHPHVAARHTYVEKAGVAQPNAAPRFDRSPSVLSKDSRSGGEVAREALRDWGFSESETREMADVARVAH